METANLNIPGVMTKDPSIAGVMSEIVLKNADDWDIDQQKGKFWSSLSDLQKFMFPFCLWIAETNHVIQTLNDYLAEIEHISAKTAPPRVKPRDRLYMLIRGWHGEFYRAREAHSRMQSQLVKIDYLDKETAAARKKFFHDALQDTLNERNKMVHTAYEWSPVHQKYIREATLRDMQAELVRLKDHPDFAPPNVPMDVIVGALMELYVAGMKLHTVAQLIIDRESKELYEYAASLERFMDKHEGGVGA